MAQVFGYVRGRVPGLLSVFLCAFCAPLLCLLCGLTLHTLVRLHRQLLADTGGGGRARGRERRSRWNTALMFGTRTLNPVALLLAPLILCSALTAADRRPLFRFGLAVSFLWVGHGLVNVCATILVFRPYRRVLQAAWMGLKRSLRLLPP